jgi:hypothetical protein
MSPTTRDLTWATVNRDDPEEQERFRAQEIRKAGERAKAAFDRLKEQGILDANGELVSKELPADMQPGADRDFGG